MTTGTENSFGSGHNSELHTSRAVSFGQLPTARLDEPPEGFVGRNFVVELALGYISKGRLCRCVLKIPFCW